MSNRDYLSCPHLLPEVVESCLKCLKTRSVKSFQCAQCEFSTWSLVQWKQHYQEFYHKVCVRCGENPELFCGECNDYQFCSVFDHLSGRKRPRFNQNDESLAVIDYESKFRAVSRRRLPVPGLVNMGATCFMNSVLQVLANSPGIRASRTLNDHFNHCNSGRGRVDNDTITSTETRSTAETASANSTACIPCEFKRVTDALFGESEDEPVVIPSNLLYAMWNFVDYLAGYTQQDAHEFLIAFLNSVDCQIRATASPYEDEDFARLFTGSVQSKLVCTVCGNASVTTEKFVDLSLNLDHHSKIPYSPHGPSSKVAEGAVMESELLLTDCLEHFTSTEQLLEKVGCSNCGIEQFRTKGLRLGNTPELLILHFKRFDFFRQRKLSRRVHFPLKGLDLKSFLSAENDQDERTYHLVGVVSHFGTLHQGHYIAYIFDADNDTWLKCDDDVVTEVEVDEVLQAEAYLLFYQVDKPPAQT